MVRVLRRSPIASGPTPTSAIKAEAGRDLPCQLASRVMRREQLDVAVQALSIRAVVFDAQVRERQMTVYHRQLPGRGKGASVLIKIGISLPVRTIQKRLVVVLQLVVEHHPAHPAALLLDAGRLGLKEAIQLRVMRDLARFDQARVVGLRTTVVRRIAIQIQELLSGLRQRHDGHGVLVDDDVLKLDEAFLLEVTEVVGEAVRGGRRVPQIRLRNDSEGTDGRQDVCLRVPKLETRLLSHGLTMFAAGKTKMVEGNPGRRSLRVRPVYRWRVGGFVRRFTPSVDARS